MKKILVLAALVAFGYSASSCRSKRADEPQKVQPTPTPGGDNTNPTTPTNPTNPTDPTTPSNPGGGGTVTPPSTDPNEVRPDAEAANAPVKLKMAEGLTFKVLEPTTGLKISGVTKQADGSYKVNAGGLVGIDGVGEKLSIEAKGATELTLDTPIPGLKNLKAIVGGAGKKLTKLSLEGVKSLEALDLQGEIAANTQVLDLSSFTKLRRLVIGGNDAALKALDYPNTEFAKIVVPQNLTQLILGRTQHTPIEGLNNLPKLTYFYAYTANPGHLTLAASSELQTFIVRNQSGDVRVSPKSIDLKNKPKLTQMILYKYHFSSVAFDGLAIDVSKLQIANTESSIPKLTLTNCSAAVVNKFLDTYAASVRDLTLTGTSLTENDLTTAIAKLQGQGTVTLSAAQATQAVRTAITAKGWTLNVAQ